MKKLILLIVFCVFGGKTTILYSQDINILLTDCESDNALYECLIYSSVGEFLGITNNKGECTLKTNSNEIIIQKFDYSTETIKVNKGINNICLNRLSIILDEVEINSSLNTKDYFLELFKKTQENGLQQLDTFYYSFSYSLEVPDSNWIDKLEGVLAIPYYSVSPKFWQHYVFAYYTTVNHHIDEAFQFSELYEKCPKNRISEIIFLLRFLSKSIHIEETVNDDMAKMKINRSLNTNSQIVFRLSDYNNYKAYGNFYFNRNDSMLQKYILYVPPDEFKIKENNLKYNYNEVVLTDKPIIEIKSIILLEFFENEGVKVNSKFEMYLIDDENEIKIHEKLPFQDVLSLSNARGMRVLQKRKEKKREKKKWWKWN